MSPVIRLPLQVIPDPNDSRACQAFADTVVDGIATRMLLDTGTYRSFVPYRYTLPSVEADERLVRVSTLQWGPLCARNLTVTMNPPDWPHPALLGMDVFGSHVCDFRFGEGILELDQSPQNHELLPLPTPSDRTPAVPISWASASTTAVWDTGAGITIVNHAWAETHPDIVSISDELGRGTGITGVAGRNPRGRLAPCRIGQVNFPNNSAA
jgi:hypothetical protein